MGVSDGVPVFPVGIPVNNLERFTEDESWGEHGGFSSQRRTVMAKVLTGVCFPFRILTCRTENRTKVREWLGTLFFILGALLAVTGIIGLSCRLSPKEPWAALLTVGFFVGGFGLALSGSVGLWCWCI
jgi:predicted cobalt transporter CbtA